jgi:hypothetical protein
MCLKCDDDDKAFDDECRYAETFWAMFQRFLELRSAEDNQTVQRIAEVEQTIFKRFDGRESER